MCNPIANRVIILIDMDCFFCQVEENLNPSWKGKPLAVVQYNQWRGGGIIAVNYSARDKGVTRHMRGDDAKEKCPDIILVKVPQVREKADLTKYRDAGKRVADVLLTFTPFLERASVDEAYLDITNLVEKRIEEKNDHVSLQNLSNTFIVGNLIENFIENVTRNRIYDEINFKLALGAVIAEEIRAEVYKVTGYRCSAGIAHNKILAKLVCGINKPNKQTILPQESITELYSNLSVKKIRSLGGKFGDTVIQKLNIKFMGELSQFSLKDLLKEFDEKSANWLYNIGKGIDLERVNTRLISKSIGCCKKFPGKSALVSKEDLEYWLKQLTDDLVERLGKDLKENNRKARQIVVSFAQPIGENDVNSSKSHPLNSYDQDKMIQNMLKILQKYCMKQDESYRITYLGISAGHFQELNKTKEITSFFKTMQTTVNNAKEISEDFIAEQQNNSIYSQTTEEGDPLDITDLIFFEQIHPESVIKDNNCKELSLNSETELNLLDNSIKEEIEFNRNNNENEPISFFNSYFNNNLSSDLNTSKKLLEETEEHNNCEKEYSSKELDNEKSQEICVQCGKRINSIELQSHLDYHVAINLVKSEAHIFKAEIPSKARISKQKPNDRNKKCKKELNGVTQKPIGKYFTNLSSPLQLLLTEHCSECNKPILQNEIEIHKDYHAAKKLHLELNSSSAKHSSNANFSKSKLKKGQRNILGFLKS